MCDSAVMNFLQVQCDVMNGEDTLKLIDRQTKTRRDISKILWELRRQMKTIDTFFGREENCSGVEDYELAWLE